MEPLRRPSYIIGTLAQSDTKTGNMGLEAQSSGLLNTPPPATPLPVTVRTIPIIIIPTKNLTSCNNINATPSVI